MEKLASKLRPNTLDKIVGQTHIVGENKILNKIIKNHDERTHQNWRFFQKKKKKIKKKKKVPAKTSLL